MDNHYDLDYSAVIEEAKRQALTCQHDIVSTDHFLLAMLHLDCLANPYLSSLDQAHFQAWTCENFPRASALPDENKIPTAWYASRITWHAAWVAQQANVGNPTSIHLLLAILSYDNHVSEKLKQAGIIFEDVASAVGLQPFPRKGPQINRREIKPATGWSKLFGRGPSIDELGEELYVHAYELFHFQQYDDCIAVCTGGLSWLPAFDRLRDLLAQSYLYKRDFVKALPAYQELVQLYPEGFNYRYSLSCTYAELGETGKSDSLFNQLLLQYPEDALLLNAKGFECYRQGKYIEAVSWYEKAILADPLFAYPYDNLGFVKFKLGHTQEALELIDKALQLDKGNSYAYMYLGRIKLEQSDKAGALNHFKKALHLRFTQSWGDEVLELIKKCEQ